MVFDNISPKGAALIGGAVARDAKRHMQTVTTG